MVKSPLPMQGMQLRSLGEDLRDPTCRVAWPKRKKREREFRVKRSIKGLLLNKVVYGCIYVLECGVCVSTTARRWKNQAHPLFTALPGTKVGYKLVWEGPWTSPFRIRLGVVCIATWAG